MADRQIGNLLGVAGRAGININGGNDTDTGLSLTNATPLTIAALRTRLAAIDGAYYTAARLNTMTMNDMVFAVRLLDQSSTF